MGDKKLNSKLFKEILKIEEEFDDIEKNFLEDSTDDISVEIKKLSFIIDKLDVLEVAYLDEFSMGRCQSLKERISKFKEEIDLEDYIAKIEIIQILRDITTSNRTINRVDLLIGINDILKKIKITDSDVYYIMEKKLVYSNKIDDNDPDIEGLSLDMRVKYARTLMENLFFMTSNSFDNSQRPFSIYEKIMIINILDNARKYLC